MKEEEVSRMAQRAKDEVTAQESEGRWAHDPPEPRKVRRAANKAYQLPRRRGLLNGEEEWRTRRQEEEPPRVRSLENS